MDKQQVDPRDYYETFSLVEDILKKASLQVRHGVIAADA